MRADEQNQDILIIRGKNNNELFRFYKSDILYLKSHGNYVLIHFLNRNEKRQEIVRNTLNGLILQLPEHDFLPIHRSFVVQLKKFDKVIRENGKHFLHSQKYEITLPLSPKMASFIEKKLKDHL